MTDAELAIRSQGGDREAFGVLAERWHSKIFRFLQRLLGNEHDARDACQEAFLRAFVNISGLRQPEHFKTWMHQIALNLCRDRARSARGSSLREVELDEATASRTPSAEPSPLDLAGQRDLARLLSASLARLPVEQRTAIVLREYQGFTSTEISTITGVPAATVRGRIFYGLKAMRRLLNEQGVDFADCKPGGLQ